jgi:omega-hydroxy-beta-dihydromenaquinone-9 sulfotransferase
MIFNFRLFWRLTVRSFFRSAGTNGPLNRNRFIVLLLFYPVWGSLTLLGWLGFALDDVFFSAYRKQVVEKPLFIVSNFRSGSTFVQRTLVRDEATFTGMRTGDIYLMPSITQRRIFSLLARVDAVFRPHLRKIAAAARRPLPWPIENSPFQLVRCRRG